MRRIILNEPFKGCKKLEADIMLKDRFIATVVYIKRRKTHKSLACGI